MKVTRLVQQSLQPRQKSYHRSVIRIIIILCIRVAPLVVHRVKNAFTSALYIDCEEEHDREHCAHSDISEALI